MNTNTALMERKAKAVKAHHEGDSPQLPAGVKVHKHQGIQRTVYVDTRNGWVFKVEKRNVFGKGCNKHEHESYLKGKDSPSFRAPSKYRLPLTLLVGDVIVMEYIKGKHATGYEYVESSAAHALGCTDLHWQNVIVTKTGLTYVVDMGM